MEYHGINYIKNVNKDRQTECAKMRGCPIVTVKCRACASI